MHQLLPGLVLGSVGEIAGTKSVPSRSSQFSGDRPILQEWPLIVARAGMGEPTGCLTWLRVQVDFLAEDTSELEPEG